MRIEKYTRELVDGAYRVIGGSTYSDNIYDYDEYEPIEMSLSKGPFDKRAYDKNGSAYDNFEELVGIAEVMSEDSEDFAENYAEIMRGNCPDWYLAGFDVSVGEISLNFANQLTGEVGWVKIAGAKRLWLTFKTPRTRLGFDPKYNVHIEHVYGKQRTTVEEDQGYLYRFIKFKTKEDAEDNCRKSPQSYMEITEYAGI